MPKKKRTEPEVPLIPASPEIRYLPIELHGRDCTMVRGYALAMFVEHEMSLQEVAEACGLGLDTIELWAHRYKWDMVRESCYQLISRRLLETVIRRKLERATTEAVSVLKTSRKLLRALDLRLDDILAHRATTATIEEIAKLVELHGRVCRDVEPIVHRIYLATGHRLDDAGVEKERLPGTSGFREVPESSGTLGGAPVVPLGSGVNVTPRLPR